LRYFSTERGFDLANLKITRTISTDVLVVGGGGAAARAALSASEKGADVRMAVKAKWLKGGSTATAFSELLAIAAAIGHGDERDTPEVHYKDTLEAGLGFIDPELVWTLASEMPERIQDLINRGLNFDKQKNGKLVQGMSDFATYPRTCRVNGVTARHILNILAREIKQREVPIDEDMMIFKLLTDENGIVGAVGIDLNTNEFVLYQTPTVILACGGAHYIYSYGVGTPDMTGNGYAMAFELGVPLINMEFVQIGPALINPPVTLLSGPIWKTNPVLLNEKNEPILEKQLPEGITVDDVNHEKAFPFTVSNASFYLDTTIQKESERNPSPHGGVWCDMTLCSEDIIEEKMPKTKRVLKSKGINVHEDRFEVGLAAQCMNGGAQIIDSDGKTIVNGLYAAGETAGGVRGPDRPGGNSLAEGQVFGHRSGNAAAAYSKQQKSNMANILALAMDELEKLSNWIEQSDGQEELDHAIASLKENMHVNCLIIRNEERLTKMYNFLNDLEKAMESGQFTINQDNFTKAIELNHMIVTAKSIVLSAKERKESRSCHYREDYPSKDDQAWNKSIRVALNNGEMIQEYFIWPTERLTNSKGAKA
jgi:succinate dehydrogenase/fumarate reductase flavoprotein subunit